MIKEGLPELKIGTELIMLHAGYKRVIVDIIRAVDEDGNVIALYNLSDIFWRSENAIRKDFYIVIN